MNIPYLSLLTGILGATLVTAEPVPATTAVPATNPAPAITSAAWLKSQPKPAFREDHTLPRLTRYGWSLPFETRVELTENWGYALEFGGYVGPETVKQLDDPNSMEARLLALAKGDPKRYPVAVICSRQLPGKEAPPETWTRDKDGRVKCYYTAGMVGANVGYYDFPPGGFDASFPAAQPPVWLLQKVASSHVHALFSQYEDLIRQGDLLPGPMRHAISTADPAFEFPTGDDTARVLVRKQRGKPVWLVTAWASDGADRTVSVHVPELGRVGLQARVCGSVYRASLEKGQVTLVQLDPEGATYTKVVTGKPVVKPVDVAVAKPSSAGLMLWLAADAGGAPTHPASVRWSMVLKSCPQ